MKPLRITFRALVVGCMLFAPALLAQKPDSANVSKLLADAKTQASKASEDAQRLQQYSRSSLSWESHTMQVKRIRKDVNDLGSTVRDLNAARPEASAWQLVAIDRIGPLLQEMADTLTNTINHMNDNPGRIHTQTYRDYASANFDLASRTSSIISDFVEYGKVKARTEQLERKLELPTANSDQ